MTAERIPIDDRSDAPREAAVSRDDRDGRPSERLRRREASPGRSRSRRPSEGDAAKRKPAARRRRRPRRRRPPKKGAPTQRRPAGRRPAGGHLVIVESPAKTKSLTRYLTPILGRPGHGEGVLRTRPRPRRRRARRRHRGRVRADLRGPARSRRRSSRELKSAAKKKDTIWLATDLDREGEAIAWHVAYAIGSRERQGRRPRAAASSSRRSRRRRCRRRSATRARSTRTSSTPSRRAACSTGSSATSSRRCCGRRSAAVCPPGRVQSVALASRRRPRARDPRVRPRRVLDDRGPVRHADRSGRAVHVVAPQRRRQEDRDRQRGRSAPARRGDPQRRHLHGHRGPEARAEAEPAASVHHVDAAAGGRAQARVLGPQDDGRRAAALRRRRARARRPGRAHHLHANRLRAPRARRGAGGPRADQGQVRRPVPAGEAARRSSPRRARRKRTRRSVRRTRRARPTTIAPLPRSRPAAALPPHLGAHDRVPDDRGASSTRRRSTSARATTCSARPDA